MANKKKIETRLKNERRKKTERLIQWVGGGVLLVVVIGLVWLLLPGRSSNVLQPPTDAPPLAEAPLDTPEPQVEAPQTVPMQYDAYPPMVIDTTMKYFATFFLAKGDEFTVELYADKAPKTVNSFVFLAHEGYFDGVTFHRVLEGFMAQGGDPTGTGTGGPGYQFEYEPNDLKFDKAGVMAMANRGAGTPTNGSQFFITFGPTPQLDGGYTIFGQVIEGMDVVNGITRRDPQTNPSFTGDAIETITITEE
jgi:cyclophilin family peptidyl-prolyl cis-trans isomerase